MRRRPGRADSRGTSTRCGCRRPGRAPRSRRRSAGTAGPARRYTARRGRGPATAARIAVLRPPQRGEQLVVTRLPDREPRRHGRRPERLRHPHVPDPRDEPLILEHLAERTRSARHGAAAARAPPGRCPRRAGRGRAAARRRGRASAPARSTASPRSDLPAGRATVGRRAWSRSGPTRQRPFIRRWLRTRDAALEPEQQVLPDRLDALEHAPVDRRGDAGDEPARMRRGGRDATARRAGGAAAAARWRESPSGTGRGRCRVAIVVYDSSRNRPMTAPLLNIAALSRRTGVAPDTLRKWEQRYGVLRPVRTAGGQRRYSETDVQRVEWLRDRIREGWRIGEAARVIDEAGSAALDEPAELRDALIASIRDSDPRRALGDARPGVRRAAARAGADRRRHTRAPLDRRGVAPRRALGRAGARDHRQGARAPRQADLGRRGAACTAWRCSPAPPASSTTSGC